MEAEKEINGIDKLIGFTETVLTARARRIEKKKRKQKSKGPIMEWVDAFLWAVMVVLLLNQYLIQAYQIPSGSMRNTLIGGMDPHTDSISTSDRIFVDKLTFGPEALPGVGKLNGFRSARRGEVIIFENPEYESPSLAHEIAQRVLYMATLSLVDLNRKGGTTAHQFLIKRLVAEDGDRILFRRGELYLQSVGEEVLIAEEEFKDLSNLEYGNHVLLDQGYYDMIEAKIKAIRTERAGLVVERELAEEASVNWVSPLKKSMEDYYENERIDAEFLSVLYPQNEKVAYQNAVYHQGIYVPRDWILPLGDNRSDSLDGRYFGPVPSNDILGRAMFIYWPLNRVGGIK